MKVLSPLAFFLCIFFFISCDKNKNMEDVSVDSFLIVYQDFHNNTLIEKFDTQTIIVESTFEKVRITGEWDLTIIFKNTEPVIVHNIPSFNDQSCTNPVEIHMSGDFGQVYATRCWLEDKDTGIPSIDSGVEKMISAKYGVVLYRGTFINSGAVISSIDGNSISEGIKKELISACCFF